MDAGYLSHQVSGIIEQLHGLFDDIGVAPHDREARETEVSLETPCWSALEVHKAQLANTISLY